MPFRFTLTLILALILGAGSAAAERHYLVYLASTPSCDLPAGFEPRPPGPPLVPAEIVNPGVSVTRELCYFNWNPAPLTTPVTEACRPNPSVVGDETCHQLHSFVASGFTILGFTAAPGFQASATATSLKVIGGELLIDREAEEVRAQAVASMGTIQLRGDTAGATFKLQSGAYIEADAVKHLVSNLVLVRTVSSCGNGSLDVPEECDDGNARSGDSCFRTCENEDSVRFEGAPTGQGAVTGTLSGADGSEVTTSVSTAGLSTAGDVAVAMASAFNADPPPAVEVDPIADTIYSDGTFRGFSSSDPGIDTVLPEPGGTLMLLSGLAFLVALGRSRTRR